MSIFFGAPSELNSLNDPSNADHVIDEDEDNEFDEELDLDPSLLWFLSYVLHSFFSFLILTFIESIFSYSLFFFNHCWNIVYS